MWLGKELGVNVSDPASSLTIEVHLFISNAHGHSNRTRMYRENLRFIFASFRSHHAIDRNVACFLLFSFTSVSLGIHIK